MPNQQKFYRLLRHNSKGFSLIEVLVALALLGIIAAAFLGGLATASKAMIIADERATAESLARTEMEYIKNCKYDDLLPFLPSWSYEIPDGNPPCPWDENHALPEGYDGYSLIVEGNIFDADGDGNDDINIQKITLLVKHHDKEIFTFIRDDKKITLEDYKVDRW